MDTYRDEKRDAVQAILVTLVQKGWNMDLAFIDWEETTDRIIKHEMLDHLEADGSPESIMLADLRGVLRAVYLNGERVISIVDEDREEIIRLMILKMANNGDSQITFWATKGDDSPRKLSKRQVRREHMITDQKQLQVGQWLMIYLAGEPSSLVKVTQIVDKFITYDEYIDGFRSGSGMSRLTELGILPYTKGIWETANWLEEVDASTNE